MCTGCGSITAQRKSMDQCFSVEKITSLLESKTVLYYLLFFSCMKHKHYTKCNMPWNIDGLKWLHGILFTLIYCLRKSSHSIIYKKNKKRERRVKGRNRGRERTWTPLPAKVLFCFWKKKMIRLVHPEAVHSLWDSSAKLPSLLCPQSL